MKNIYVGVNDKSIDLFEGMYRVPNGMSYNSYIIRDEKSAVFDTVDEKFGGEWLDNVSAALDGRNPDYLIILHMEPDHSANIFRFMEKYPDTCIVGNSKTFVLIKEFFGDFAFNRLEVKDGDTLSLGSRSLTFVFAPMVHWPEVMTVYDGADKALYSADAFGKFGSLDTEEEWEEQARRYYYGIVGKFGNAVQGLFKKLSAYDIQKIYPLHGPALTENVGYYMNKYDLWSRYAFESEGVFIAYNSIYGHTRKAVELLAKLLEENGTEVIARDLARDDWAQCVADAFKYRNTVIAATTYNGDVFPAVREFIDRLKERNFRNRRVGIIENGGWAPFAAKAIQKRLEDCKDIEYCPTQVTLHAALDGQSSSALKALADELKG